MSAGASMGEENIETYMYQWLKTAGDFSEEFAWAQNRLKIQCRKCHAVYLTTKPKSALTLSWELQAWVYKHRPDGPHDKEVLKNPMDAQPLTAVSPYDYSTTTNTPYISPGGLTGDTTVFPTGGTTAPQGQIGQFDASPTKAEIIKLQMEKYKKEQENASLKEQVKWFEEHSGKIPPFADTVPAPDPSPLPKKAKRGIKLGRRFR